MRKLAGWIYVVLACATLGACAGSQAGYQDSYAATSGYYDDRASYGYDRVPRAPCRCNDDRYGQYQDNDSYPYRN